MTLESVNKNIIHQGNSIISLETPPDYPHPVVVKKSSERTPSRLNVKSLENEYVMTRSLSDVEGVRKVLEQRSTAIGPELILEYVDGKTLRDHVYEKKLTLRSRLKIAVDLAHILAKIHEQNVIHLDFNSHNILIGNKGRALHFIDLSAASRIDGNVLHKIQPDQALGNLQYISPEQTGRINRAVDERSDLYSLGVVLYELMTRRLPFDSKDPADLIHDHIARTPVLPSVQSTEIPEVISTIIMKLLSKDPENRYQSADGVRADLEKCLQGLGPGNTIEKFQVGEADHASRFRYPEKLYGREGELKKLLDVFKKASRQASSMIFISGYSGTGKTALVEEMQQPVSEKQGYFIRGKFDQYLRTTPYSGVTQAFDEFVSRILAQPEEDFNMWRDRIRSAVGELGKVITEVIPTLEDLIGPQPDVPELTGQEAENRFNYVFINFLSSIADEKHPLVLFIDDLQWIDPASLRLLETIRSDFDHPGLLLVGAYRDNEVDASHPLMGIIGKQEKKGNRFEVVHLDNLQPIHLQQLLSETLKVRKGIRKLGATIHNKTGGNPFFLRRLLASLNTEGHIHYDPEAESWKWDIEEIESGAIADNVVDLLAQTIVKLPEKTKNILKLAACIGNRFYIPTLAMISGFGEKEVVKYLTESSNGQYVLGTGDFYEFVHDQVQQAAYTLIDEKSRPGKHLEIGRLLLSGTKETELEERVFDIVTQYNLGADFLTDQAEKVRVAELNLIAGRKARLAAAFAASAVYVRQGLTLLGESAWQDHYRLTLDVHSELIELSFLNVQNEEVETLFATIAKNAKQDVDAGVAHKALIMSCIAHHELVRAISLAECYLERLGVTLDSERESDLPIAELYELPQMEDREKLAVMGVLMVITTPALLSTTERLPSVIYTMLNIISRHGNSSVSSYAYSWYAMLLCMQQRYQEGNRFGQLAIDLLEKYPHPGRTAEIMNIQCALLRHWSQPIHDQITPLKTYHRMAMQAGDFEHGVYCLANYTLLLWGSGKPLEHCLAEVEPGIALCQSKNQQFTLQVFLMNAEFFLSLTGMSPAPTRLEGKWFSEETMMSRFSGNHWLLAYYGLLKMILHYLFGEPGAAYDHVVEILKHRGSLNPHYLYTKISFYGALSCIAGLPDGESDADRQERLENLRLFEEELKLWAQVAPMNYRHQYHLLLAEKSRVTKKHWEAIQFFEKAVKGAQENRFVHDEALAKELYGRFWSDQGNDSIAEMYLRAARTLYQQWGAAAKVAHLESSYPHYFETRSVSDGQPDTSGTQHIEAADPITPVQMDMDGIISASQMLNVSQVLSSKTDLDQLLIKMMELVMTHSGATTAVLLLRQEEGWFVQAYGDIDSKESAVLLNQPFDPSGSDSETGVVPAAVFQYCLRSKGALVVEDGTLDQRFAGDRTVKAHGIRSMACIPALSRGEIRAMLYLENRHMVDVFTLDRVEILTHLSSQFGVSVENALLYESLNRKIWELQESEERYALAVAGSAAGLWDWDIPSNELYVSDRLLELLGFAPDEISFTMDEFWSQLHPDDHPVVRRAVDAHLEKRVPFYMDYRLQTRSGEYRWFHARGQALWDETGKATRMSGSLTDIDQRKEAESALMDSRQKLIKAEQIAGMGFLDWDLQTNEIKWSREVYDLYGIDPETPATIELIIGLIHPADHEFVKENLDLAIQGVRDYDIDHRMIRPDGKVIWVHARADLEWDKDDRPTTMLGTVVDITERKKAEEEVRIQQDALARVDRTTRMGQLAGSIAHELNQPLTGILSTAQAGEIMVKRGQCEPDEMAEVLAAIAADAKRAGRVIHSLRELYRDQKRDLEPVDVNDVIDETVLLLHSELIKQHAQVTTQRTSSAPMVKGNRVQIQQVLLNLIMNGNQAMSGMVKEDRHLHLETACDEKEVRVWVQDSGPGIDADKIDRIFEPLTTWKSGGTGMGLAMSQSIVRTHQGRMWAENRPEGGARVGFTLPLLEEEQQA